MTWELAGLASTERKRELQREGGESLDLYTQVFD